MSEIRLRAIAQIGKISRELEKAQTVHTKEHGSEIRLASSGKSKSEQLEEAGLSVRTANRYEQLAAPEEQLAAPRRTNSPHSLCPAACPEKAPHRLVAPGLFRKCKNAQLSSRSARP